MDAWDDCRGQNIDHNGHSYIVRITKMGRLITHNTRHIQKTPITTELFFRE